MAHPKIFAVTLMAGLGMIAACTGQASAHDLRILLLEADDCGACQLYRSFGDGYPGELRDHPGIEAPIPVSVVDKSAIPAAIAAQFQPHEYWSQSLSVMVLDGDEVLHVGNIAEASDIANARFPDAIMAPANAAGREGAAQANHFYGEHFKETWKLGYFVDAALGRRQPHPSIRGAMLGADGGIAGVSDNNLVLWGSTATPSGNPLYISERIADTREALTPIAGPSLNVITLYGNGDDPRPDTSLLVNGEERFIQSPIHTPHSPDLQTLGRLFESLRGTDHNLLVQIGHSGPTGAPLWGHLATVDAPLLESLVDKTGTELVMVSGACNSGQFAAAPSCGFFAAHPEVVATGCQKSPEALRGSDDYLGEFFGGVRSSDADLYRDGTVSFAEAHWYASVRLEHHQIPYDSLDALVDAYWQANADALPNAIEFARLANLARRVGSAEEQWAVTQFVDRVPGDTPITTSDALRINREALEKVAAMTEASSVERNATMALAYPLVLSSLARRLLWRDSVEVSPAAAKIRRCASQGIGDFLRGGEPQALPPHD
ncbi:hypothetical protein [Lysobacter sp. F6437]|uniref:hypothetical protein n=1 Tax=Lysobacter sp. F6437 TaxID=3459296 RepID=UPI00403DF09A